MSTQSKRPSRSELGPVTRQYVQTLGWRALNLHFHISLVNRYCYVEVPKAGCGTMKATLGGLEAARLNQGFVDRVQERPHDRTRATPFVKPFQLPPDQLEEVLSDSRFTRFTVVRDPATRVLSAYLEKIRQGLKQSAAVVDALEVRLGHRIDASDITFEQFLNVVESQSIKEQDPHWRVQSAHIGLGTIDYDAIIHLEDLDRSWEQIGDLIGAPDVQEQFYCRTATHAATHTAEYFTPELQIQTSRIYAADYDAFGYPRP
jgi:hypothetical protein